MKIGVVRIQNFRRIEFAVLDFAVGGAVAVDGVVEGVAGVSSNGAGKSTVTREAPTWALYGRMFKPPAAADDVIRETTKTACVSIDFEQRGTAYRVVRTRSRGKEMVEVFAGDVAVDMPGTLVAANAVIEAIIGLDFETWKFAFAFGQDSPRPITQAGDAEAKALLNSVFDLGWIERVAAVAKARTAAAAVDIADHQAAAARHRLAAEKERALADSARALLVTERARDAAERERLGREVDRGLLEIAGKAREKDAVAAGVAERVARAVAERAAAAAEVESAEAAIARELAADTADTLEINERRRARVAAVSAIDVQIESAKAPTASTVFDPVLDVDAEVAADAAADVDERAAAHAAYAAGAEVDRSAAILEDRSAPCPTCKRDWPEKAALVPGIRADLAAAEAVKAKAVAAHEAAKAKSKATWAAVDAKKAEHARSVSDVCAARAERVRAVAVLEFERERIGAETDRPRDSSAARTAYARAATTARTRAAALSTWIAEGAAAEAAAETERIAEDLSRAVGRVEDLRRQQQAENPRFAELEAAMSAAVSRHDAALAAYAEESAATTAADAVLRVRRFWSELGWTNRGVRSWLLDAAAADIGRRANANARVLGGDIRIAVRMVDRTKAGEPRDRFTVSVTNADGASNYAGQSGGEAARADVAVSLALQEIVKERAGGLNVLVLDEAWGAVDAAGREGLVAAAHALGRDRTVFVVSHDPETRKAFSRVVTLRKAKWRGSVVDGAPGDCGQTRTAVSSAAGGAA